MANTNIMKATWPVFYDLQDKNLTMFSQYTAAPWEYIGTQGVIQGTFETLAAIADQHFGGIARRTRSCSPPGWAGMGGNQTRAMTMLGGVCVAVDADERVIERRIETGFCDVVAPSLDEAIDAGRTALAAEGRAAGHRAGRATPPRCSRPCSTCGWRPDVVTEMCPCHDPISYIPAGLTPDSGRRAATGTTATSTLRRARQSMITQLEAMIGFHDEGVQVFEYGTSIRKECRDAGMPEQRAMQIPGFVAAYLRQLFLLGRGPFPLDVPVWRGRPTLLGWTISCWRCSPTIETTVKWITLAREHIPIEALPARVCYLGFGERKAFGVRVNELIRSGEVAGPVAFSRDNLDSGSIVNPTFESEKMLDGSDLISDWPYLNALLNTAAMCDLVAIQANYSMGEAVHTGVTMIADGSEEADLRLEACLTTDSGIGVVRHAQAGYPEARAGGRRATAR